MSRPRRCASAIPCQRPRIRPRGGAEAPIEFLRAIDRADDRVERDRLQAETALADAAERLDDLVERKDHVEVGKVPRGGGRSGAPAPAHDG